ncbi:TIGR02530 family flagellar biosynthesis protein [Bacillus benzoevorans]|uniref:Flagellar operon protein n=1 Tax=Bacillus benzoevorans TaxID=1456 RepID=A0A7X0LTU0_9BACI|nr:TIGR02530 family flagellar biosynthesis protein [Bacillus benzoevorans]MBB6443848.1 flagellar operon protein [Bacillus benzoevorans]
MNAFNYHPVTTQPFIPGEFKTAQKITQGQRSNFAAALQTALDKEEGLTLSRHAKERLEQRGIQINASRWEQIGEKVREAKKMGVNDSLVLLDNAALIVSAKNETVITAMNRAEASAHIFTNINGTILMD